MIITRLGAYGGPRQRYGSFAGKRLLVPAFVPASRIAIVRFEERTAVIRKENRTAIVKP